MRRLIVTSSAKRDLADIISYIARSSGQMELARSFAGALLGHARRLAALPGSLGVLKAELGAAVRVTPHRGYVFVFRYETGAVRLLRVLEGHRNLVDQPTSDET